MHIILEFFKKLVFLFKPTYLKDKSVQTEFFKEKSLNCDQSIQTIQFKEHSSIEIQTDIKMPDICEGNEWFNLTWSKSIPIVNRENLIDIV